MDLLAVMMDQITARYRKLTKIEQIDRVRRARAGDSQAREELIDSAMPAVVKIALAAGRGKRRQIVMDLIQDGAVGLVQSIETFDVDRDVSWFTYAYRGARFAIYTALRLNDQQSREKYLKPNLDGEIVVVDTRRVPIDSATLSEVVHTAKKVRDRLRDRDSRGWAVVKHRLRGGTLDTAGEELGVSRARAAVLFNRTVTPKLSTRLMSEVVCRETAHVVVTTLTR